MLSALYSKPVSDCSPFATIGNTMSTVAGFPAASLTVTVTLAVFASAAVSVPEITPVLASMDRPDGSPVAL